ncbi:MAG TPA: DUF3863 domain-containing protein [Fimbriimonadaceae bacterium]|nr:DUF3863 domain-containing protein [Fimbriimonadaceae bacterium]
MTRRSFLKSAALAAAAGALPGQPKAAGVEPAKPLDGRRVLTFNSIIRVNQIEVTRTRNEGVDEYDRHTPENINALRSAFAEGWPGAPMTWALSWLALHDERPNYVAARQLMREFHDKYGDDVTFIPGAYFANMYNTREQVNEDIHDGLAKVGEIMGGGFRPKSLLAGFLAAENQKYLAEHEGIHVCQGDIWSQFGIDNGDGDGSISYPYYPSTEHFCKPAQGRRDFIDCVSLDGWTMDFVSARLLGIGSIDVGGKKVRYNSRLGVGPIETIGWYGPEKGLQEIMDTTAIHFDDGFKLNRWAWVTDCWEVSLVPEIKHLEVLTKWLQGIRERWPRAECLTQGEFGEIWRRQYRDNSQVNYRFVQRGTGIGGSGPDLEIRWFMNHKFRLALLRKLSTNEPANVIDFTRYDLPAHEPKDLGRNWSLLGEINQKETRPQDKPRPLDTLTADDQRLIHSMIPDI